jgi:hypothetical protein
MSPDIFDERVAVIVGSTRPTRICPGIAEWTRRALSEKSRLRYGLIDLAEVLPMLDEPLKAALGTSTCTSKREQSDQQLRRVRVRVPAFQLGLPGATSRRHSPPSMANLASSGRSKQRFQEVVTRHGRAVLDLCRALVGVAEAREAWTEVFLCALSGIPAPAGRRQYSGVVTR